MRFLHRQRDDGALRDIEVLPLPRESSFLAGPNVDQQAQSFLPSWTGLLRGNPKAAEFLDSTGAPGTDFDSPLAQDIERSDTFGYPHGMVVRKRQQHHRVADTNSGGPLTERTIEHLRCRRMRESGLKMRLDTPEIA